MEEKSVDKLRFTSLWLIIGFLLVAFVMFVSLIPIPTEAAAFTPSDKLCHVLAYFCLTFWFSQIYRQNRVRLAFALAFVMMGIGIEYLQGLTGYRSFEYADMAANTVGVACGLIAAQTPLARTLLLVEKCLYRFVR
jgi:VanZ family protein